MADDEHELGRAHARPTLAAAIADLMAIDALRDDEAAMRAALRAAVADACDPAGALWDQYRGGRPGRLGSVRRAVR